MSNLQTKVISLILLILSTISISLKLTSIINWHWLIILIPIYPFLIILFLCCSVFIVYFIGVTIAMFLDLFLEKNGKTITLRKFKKKKANN